MFHSFQMCHYQTIELRRLAKAWQPGRAMAPPVRGVRGVPPPGRRTAGGRPPAVLRASKIQDNLSPLLKFRFSNSRIWNTFSHVSISCVVVDDPLYCLEALRSHRRKRIFDGNPTASLENPMASLCAAGRVRQYPRSWTYVPHAALFFCARIC